MHTFSVFFFFFSVWICFVMFFFFNFLSWYQFNFVSFSCWKFNFTYFSHNYDNYAMFRDDLECSGMFRNVPCSWFYRRPLISMKNIIWTKSGHACRSTSGKFGPFFAFRKVFLPPLWMKLYSYWTFCHASLIWLPLFVNFRN